MSLCNTKSTKSEEFSRRQTRSSRPILIDCNVVPEEEEEEEDEEEEEEEEEDVDFNPFLKETSSPEASSSLSSDDDEGNVEETNLPSLNSIDEVQDGKEGNEEEEEEEEEEGEEEEEEEEVPVQSVMERPRKRKSVENNASTSGVDVVEDGNNEVRNETTESDDEDAICRRTRARYSLANFSLDELETFLQETDDDEDLKHVDDEEEYRKFLAAVLQGGESEGQAVPENGNVYDDDEEDYDADFDAELEEALDSDPDEGMGEKMNEDFDEGRRRKTRQNNRKQKKLLGQVNRPLRPLVPLPAFPGICPPRVLLDRTINCPPPTEAGLVNGFTAHQIGQLHCLIHEHTQLLVQIYSLSVLDSTRQHIAAETRKLMSELVYTRDNVLSWRKVAYPDYCFRPPYIHPSISGEVPKFHPLHVPVDLSSPARQKEMPAPHSVSSLGRCNDGGQVDSLRTNRNSMWVPQVSSPVLSILDAAPLSLVGSYMADVSRAVREYRKRHLEGLFDTHFEKKPMYPLFNIPLSHEANGEALKRTTSQGPTTISPSLAAPQPPKKTLAAALVESTKTQSVAFAPEEIVALAQRFYPLFNTALYPRKPPLAAVANRVLFTDTEDELLAMGMMEYNTDWKAIQQRFLPCKSKHQIFVRQKNRCSAKAPENPIKAVRQMKTSPLTEEEKACIHKGLKVFKLDWMSVWKFIVPYRDPSLLPRQWRVATGTQKSYKSDAAKREKRHLYLAQKRLSKAPALVNWQPVPEKEDNVDHNAAEGNISENDNMEDEDEAYVHEAFLADWTPRNSRSASSERTLASVSRRDSQPGVLVSREDSCANQIPVSDWYGGLHPGNHAFLSSNFPQHYPNVSHFSHVRYSASYTVASNHFGPDCLSKSSKSQVSLRPHRVRRKKDAQSVKLAPDLPPVNLPPSVRVVSQSAFKSYHCVASHSIKVSSSGAETESLVPRLAEVAKSGKTVSANSGSKVSAPHSTPRDQRVHVDRPAAENLVPRLAEVAKSGKTVSVNSRSKVSAPSSHSTPQGPRVHSDRSATEDRNAGMDLQMHPLLLQAPEDGRLPYCPVNSSTSASGTFNFIAGNQLHSNFGHFCRPSDAGSIADGFYSSLSLKNSSRSCAIDFHPLLQRKDDGNLAQHRNSSGSVMTEPHVPSGPKRTAPVPASPNEMAHDLDLEIHLSSTSRKEKVTTCRKVTEHHSNDSRNGLLNIGIRKETNRTMNLSQERSENCPTASIPASSGNQGRVLGNQTLLLPNNTSRCTEDHVGDKPPPGIVMEQEELSDSEEEKGEDVEFECEEMDDSDREESDRE